jgi:outer membrane protein assembly factor BamB
MAVLATTMLLGVQAVLAAPPAEKARRILTEAGVHGGLVVHLGCGDGSLTTAFRASDAYLVHGLDADPSKVAAVREMIREAGLYGPVCMDGFDGKRLPYVGNLVNLLVADDLGDVPMDEVRRVLAPGGVAMVGGKKIVKPWPDEIDEWTHYLHDATNNAVADDTVVGPPRHMQWVAGPRWTRHHDWLSSLSSAVTAGGRLFTIFDEASPANLNLPGKWAVIARDAFSGVRLWRRPMAAWVSHRQRFRTGPTQAARLLVATEERVYVPLGLNAPVSALDAATGETVATYEATANAEEIILTGHTLLVLTGDLVTEQAFTYPAVRKTHKLPNAKTLVAVDTNSGKTRWRWSPEGNPVPVTLASDGMHAYLSLDTAVVAVDLRSGKERWRYDGEGRPRKPVVTWGRRTLVVADGTVLFNMADHLVALSAETGEKRWSCPTGTAFHAPLDVFAIDGRVWHRLGHAMDPMRVPPEHREARDLRTGELLVSDAVAAHLLTPGHHYRCYRGKATRRFLIVSKRGVEMMDVAGNDHFRNNWVRGSCQYGVLPANGLLYTPPNSCGCYAEAMLRGFWALAARRPEASRPECRVADGHRLEKGPAYGSGAAGSGPKPREDDWPAFRHDPLRSGVATTTVPAGLRRAWRTDLGGRLTQPVVAGGCIVVAGADSGVVYCLDETNGKIAWTYCAGGRVDSSPTVHGGTVLFGSAAGRVTCLRLRDGEVAWRFMAAPADLRGVAMERVASPWPVHGSVLVLDGVAYVVAGRSTWLDGGLRLWALDPATGEVLHQRTLRSEHPQYQPADDTEAEHLKGHLWTDYKTFTQPDKSDTYSIAGGVSDVLVSDGTNVFIRHLALAPNLEDEAGRSGHLFSTSSLLDGAEHHRSDWGIGTGAHGRLPAARHKGGFSRFHQEDAAAKPPYRADNPTGLLLVFAGDTVWGVERKHRRRSFGEYRLFKKALASPKGKYVWQTDLAVRPRALVKAGDRLVLGVAPAVIPEDDPHAAYEGRRGGVIRVYAEADGGRLGETSLDAPPAWDGMAVAGGKLYVATVDGKVVCLAGKELRVQR